MDVVTFEAPGHFFCRGCDTLQPAEWLPQEDKDAYGDDIEAVTCPCGTRTLRNPGGDIMWTE